MGHEKQMVYRDAQKLYGKHCRTSSALKRLMTTKIGAKPGWKAKGHTRSHLVIAASFVSAGGWPRHCHRRRTSKTLTSTPLELCWVLGRPPALVKARPSRFLAVLATHVPPACLAGSGAEARGGAAHSPQQKAGPAPCTLLPPPHLHVSRPEP